MDIDGQTTDAAEIGGVEAAPMKFMPSSDSPQRQVPREEQEVDFWERQFSGRSTPTQHAFDVLVGLVLPAICFVADPAVFQTRAMMGAPLLRNYRIFAYGTYGTAMVALVLWLLAGRRLGRVSSLLAGAMLVGAAASTATGLAILPMTLLGLLLLIGVLGLVPFAAAFVYWRNAVRAWHYASAAPVPQRLGFGLVTLGALITFVPAGALNHAAWTSSAEYYLSEALRGAAGELVVADVVRGDWDRMFVFGPYTPAKSIDEALGFAWDDPAKDYMHADEGNFLVLFAASDRVTGFAILDRWSAESCSGQLGPLKPADARFTVTRDRRGQRWLCPVGYVPPLRSSPRAE